MILGSRSESPEHKSSALMNLGLVVVVILQLFESQYLLKNTNLNQPSIVRELCCKLMRRTPQMVFTLASAFVHKRNLLAWLMRREKIKFVLGCCQY